MMDDVFLHTNFTQIEQRAQMTQKNLTQIEQRAQIIGRDVEGQLLKE